MAEAARSRSVGRRGRPAVLALLLLAWLLVGCQAADLAAPTPPPIPTVATFPLAPGPLTGGDGHAWWEEAVFYEVFVRSFYDSDGDGVGDLNGLIDKLDYLNDGDPTSGDDLGVTGIWLMPIMQSPSYHGYDVADYYRVDDEYGTNDDFRRLMAEAHRRGIRVIVDMVLNHTSTAHPWFQAAQEPASPFRDYYVWSDSPPPQQGSYWHPTSNGYYYGFFWGGMPDLNFENPAVTDEMQQIARFWLEEMGVDGFRLDAIKYLVESGGAIENTPATLDWLAQYRQYVKSINPEALLVGEIWSPSPTIASYVPDQVDIAFEFDLASSLFGAVYSRRSDSIRYAAEQTAALYPPRQFAPFLTNHDQDRIMSELSGSMSRGKLAATLLLTAPGTPFIYYGEEVGLMGRKPDEQIRRPMQWSGDDSGGFTSGTPWQPLGPGFRDNNVAAMAVDPDSLLNHYRALIQLRNQHEALRAGDWLPVAADPPQVAAFLRQSPNETILVLLNLGREAVTDYTVSLAGGLAPVNHGLLLFAGPPLPEAPAAAAPLAPPPVIILPAPLVNEAGGFAGYRPVDALPAESSVIIQLAP